MPPTSPNLGLIRPAPNFNPSPKTTFRDTADWISQHRALLESPAFDRAIQFAQLEYQLQAAAQVKDGNGALALGYKLLGVAEFITTLKLLSEVPKISPQQHAENLAHHV